MSQIRLLPDANVRSQSYLVARTSLSCARCGLPTRLLALALPRGHETLGEDVPSDGAEPSSMAWQPAHVNAFLFDIEQVPDGVRDQLTSLSRFYRPVHDTATLTSCWANHCEHCGTALDDHELHCEPGAFMASSEAAAANIELVHIQAPFAAVASGYAMDPEFFAFMRRI
jgi:hypothetical protein